MTTLYEHKIPKITFFILNFCNLKLCRNSLRVQNRQTFSLPFWIFVIEVCKSVTHKLEIVEMVIKLLRTQNPKNKFFQKIFCFAQTLVCRCSWCEFKVVVSVLSTFRRSYYEHKIRKISFFKNNFCNRRSEFKIWNSKFMIR